MINNFFFNLIINFFNFDLVRNLNNVKLKSFWFFYQLQFRSLKLYFFLNPTNWETSIISACYCFIRFMSCLSYAFQILLCSFLDECRRVHSRLLDTPPLRSVSRLKFVNFKFCCLSLRKFLESFLHCTWTDVNTLAYRINVDILLVNSCRN